MLMILQVATVCLAAVAMATALAHALELPGKLRLDKDAYLAVQQIYYPGFTIAGSSEGLSIVAVLTLLVLTPPSSPAFPWVLIGFIGLAAMHAAYWMMTHPVSKFWLKDTELKGMSKSFFAIGASQRGGEAETGDLWKRYRDRWEYSHVVRTILSGAAFVALVIATAMR